MVPLEVGAEKLLSFDVAGAGGPARADGGELVRVLVGAGAIKVLCRCSEGSDKERDEED
jgi:hypothetical protein